MWIQKVQEGKNNTTWQVERYNENENLAIISLEVEDKVPVIFRICKANKEIAIDAYVTGKSYFMLSWIFSIGSSRATKSNLGTPFVCIHLCVYTHTHTHVCV